MTSQPPPRQPVANWLLENWRVYLREIFPNTHPRLLLETLRDSDKVVFTRQALADRFERRLKDEGELAADETYNTRQLNDMLPVFEKVGVIERVPEWSDDENSVIYRNRDILEDWFAATDQPFDPEAPLEPPPATADSIVYYLGRALMWSNAYTSLTQPLADDDVSYDIGPVDPPRSNRPLEARLYRVTQTHAYASSPRVDLEIGSYQSLSEDAKQLLMDLDLGITLPTPDNGVTYADEWDYTHDYAIAGVQRAVEHVGDEGQLTADLLRHLRSRVAGPLELYARKQDGAELPLALSEDAHKARIANLPPAGLGRPTKMRGGDVDVDGSRVLFGFYVRNRARTAVDPSDAPDEPDDREDWHDSTASTDETEPTPSTDNS